jgi:hypothetical protein
MSHTDAYLFPVMGSAVLFGLYLVFKFLRPDLINLLVAGYFGFLGVVALSTTLSELLHGSGKRKHPYRLKFTIPFVGLGTLAPALSILSCVLFEGTWAKVRIF